MTIGAGEACRGAAAQARGPPGVTGHRNQTGTTKDQVAAQEGERPWESPACQPRREGITEIDTEFFGPEGTQMMQQAAANGIAEACADEPGANREAGE